MYDVFFYGSALFSLYGVFSRALLQLLQSSSLSLAALCPSLSRVIFPSRTFQGMDFDAELSRCGDWGPYQKMVLYFLLVPGTLPCAFQAYNQLFMATVPQHWCNIHSSNETIKNFRYSNIGLGEYY